MSYAIAMYFNAHTGRAVANLTALNDRLAGTARAAHNARAQTEQIRAMASSLGMAGRKLTTHLTLPMTALGAVMVRSAGQMEAWELGFSNMLRSSEKGKRLLWDLVKLADSTPFVDSTIIRGAQQLIGTGLDEKSAPHLLRQLGDVTAGIGGDNNTLFRLIAGTSKALEKGRLNMEALEPFMSAGAGIIQKMADLDFGGERELMFEEMGKGKVRVELLYRALSQMTGESGRFYKAMEKQSETIPGLWSTLVGKAQTTSALFGGFLVDEYGIKDKIKGLSGLVVELGESIDKMPKSEKTFLAGLITATAAAGPLLMGLNSALQVALLPVVGLIAAQSALALPGIKGTAAAAGLKGIAGLSSFMITAGGKAGKLFARAFVPAMIATAGYQIHKHFGEKIALAIWGGKENIERQAELQMKNARSPKEERRDLKGLGYSGWLPQKQDETIQFTPNDEAFANLTDEDRKRAIVAEQAWRRGQQAARKDEDGAPQYPGAKQDGNINIEFNINDNREIGVSVRDNLPQGVVNLFSSKQQLTAQTGGE